VVAGDQSDPVDVLVLGGGPAGYVCALRAAQNGRSVTLVERERVGGVCLTRGCIPSKHLAVFAAAKASAERFAPAGMPAFAAEPDLASFQARRSAAIDGLVKGVASLLDAAGVRVVQGDAWFVGRTRVCVAVGEESVRYFDFKDVVIATGSCAAPMPGLPLDGVRVVEPSQALEMVSVPATLLVAGADYLSLELAVAYARLGSRVTIATRGDRLLPDFDADISQAAQRGARSAGVAIDLATDPVTLESAAERVIVSAGRTPNFAGLHLDAAGFAVGDGPLVVDDHLRIDRHVYAIGDITGEPLLAHRAMAQGRVAGEILGGQAAALDLRAVPRVVFAEPELASVGVSEVAAREAGQDIIVGRFPLAALGRAVIESSTSGFAKLLFARDGAVLVGAHLAGPRATDLIAEMALAIEMGATAEDLALTLHAHPTFAEPAMEAAEVALGRPIHVRAPKR
jgi:dihydrolipoamide dehydrogenase